VGKEEEVFFFEKKNQETFARWRCACAICEDQKNKSLFASFSSEREVLPLLRCFLQPPVSA
jgi:hypothetical protein